MEYLNWLEALKESDKVIVEYNLNNHYSLKRGRIKSIIYNREDNSNEIAVDYDNEEINFVNGYAFGNNYTANYVKIIPCTRQLEEKITQQEFIDNVVEKMNKEKLTFQTAQKINEILNLGVKNETIEY